MKEESKVKGYATAYEYDDITRRSKCLSLIDYLNLDRLSIFNYSAGDKLASLKKFGKPNNAIYYNMDSGEYKLAKIELKDEENSKYEYTIIKDLPTYKDLFNEIGATLSKSQLAELEKKFKYKSEINDENSIYLEYELERKPYDYNIIWSDANETMYDVYFQLPKRKGNIHIEGNEDTSNVVINSDRASLEIQNSHPLLKYMIEYFLENKEKISDIKKLDNGYLYNNTYYRSLDDLIDDFIEDDDCCREYDDEDE